MARGKYLSLEEARKQKRLDRFCKENPSGFPRVLGMGCVVSLDMGHAEGLKPPHKYRHLRIARRATEARSSATYLLPSTFGKSDQML